ncbi:hypothetical protein KA005_21830, partial [bacterium]|nr:hypothetical protein [bacterium]
LLLPWLFWRCKNPCRNLFNTASHRFYIDLSPKFIVRKNDNGCHLREKKYGNDVIQNIVIGRGY